MGFLLPCDFLVFMSVRVHGRLRHGFRDEVSIRHASVLMPAGDKSSVVTVSDVQNLMKFLFCDR